jgi:hypothetical protein
LFAPQQKGKVSIEFLQHLRVHKKSNFKKWEGIELWVWLFSLPLDFLVTSEKIKKIKV